MYNPDAPIETSGGWSQHTYQQPQQNDSFYWSGSFNGMAPNLNDGSRRNVPFNPVNPTGVGQNPFNSFGQYGQQNQSIPENNVQPFSSYPPTAPQQNMGLNGMLDSRRNTPNYAPQSAPWMQQNNQVPQQQNWNPAPNPYMGNPYDLSPGYKIDMNTSALYNNQNQQFGFDKHAGIWDNYYTQQRQIAPPMNWNAQPQNTINSYSAYQNSVGQYPDMNQLQTTQQNWKDIAVKNWG